MGLAEPLVWAPVLVGIAPVALFATRQHTISEPLLDLRIFTFREYRVSIVAQCLLYGCFMGMTLIIPLTVIEAGGHNAFEAGLVLFPGALAALVFEPGVGMATDRFGARKVAIFGGCFRAPPAHTPQSHTRSAAHLAIAHLASAGKVARYCETSSPLMRSTSSFFECTSSFA